MTPASANRLAKSHDAALAGLIDAALSNIHKARCGTNFCAPTTGAERAKPPVTIADARQAADFAADGATAKWCGIQNHHRIFIGYMGLLRSGKKYDDRKIATLTLVHGMVQGMSEAALRKKGRCPEALRQNLEALAARTFNQPRR